MSNTILHTIYDVITKQEIQFFLGSFLIQAKSMGICNTKVSHLSYGRRTSINDRYILPHNKHLLFTLVDFQTGREYDCITNKTIFIHLKQPYNDNEGKYVYELKKQRQNLSTICGRLFYLKGYKPAQPFTRTNSEGLVTIQDIRKYNQLKSKIVHQLRSRLWSEIQKRLTAKKSDHTLSLLGCSLDTFIRHVENQFTQGMSWENYGQWHIDHIRPCSSFRLLDETEQKLCFHYTNLQPLWALDNLRKGKQYNAKT
jgi:hypothetical protein